MREIEFKAKTIDDRRWVYGDLIHHFSVKNGVSAYHVSVGIDYNFCEVIPETACEFTGLYDKNGEKIFEGDKFKYYEHDGFYLKSFTGFVKYESGSFGFEIIDRKYYLDFLPFSEFDELWEDFLRHLEVVGNINDEIK